MSVELYGKSYDITTTYLDLNYKQISVMCSEIGRLINLESLNLSGNKIKVICPEIGRLINLKKLDLQDNLIKVICPEIGLLLNLNSLYMGYCVIVNLRYMQYLRQLIYTIHMNDNVIKASYFNRKTGKDHKYFRCLYRL